MKFSIRDLLLVTVIVAVCVAWWVDRSKLAARLKPFLWLEELEEKMAKAKESPTSQAPAPNPSKP